MDNKSLVLILLITMSIHMFVITLKISTMNYRIVTELQETNRLLQKLGGING